mmetsp:Transcript_57169/g.83910  ORF Transcript_57169/g.83910 Transcript_57169/m.83910 type:complete len:432 (+) Transcript_57169:82-1377(+)
MRRQKKRENGIGSVLRCHSAPPMRRPTAAYHDCSPAILEVQHAIGSGWSDSAAVRIMGYTPPVFMCASPRPTSTNMPCISSSAAVAVAWRCRCASRYSSSRTTSSRFRPFESKPRVSSSFLSSGILSSAVLIGRSRTRASSSRDSSALFSPSVSNPLLSSSLLISSLSNILLSSDVAAAGGSGFSSSIAHCRFLAMHMSGPCASARCGNCVRARMMLAAASGAPGEYLTLSACRPASGGFSAACKLSSLIRSDTDRRATWASDSYASAAPDLTAAMSSADIMPMSSLLIDGGRSGKSPASCANFPQFSENVCMLLPSAVTRKPRSTRSAMKEPSKTRPSRHVSRPLPCIISSSHAPSYVATAPVSSFREGSHPLQSLFLGSLPLGSFPRASLPFAPLFFNSLPLNSLPFDSLPLAPCSSSASSDPGHVSVP